MEYEKSKLGIAAGLSMVIRVSLTQMRLALHTASMDSNDCFSWTAKPIVTCDKCFSMERWQPTKCCSADCNNCSTVDWGKDEICAKSSYAMGMGCSKCKNGANLRLYRILAEPNGILLKLAYLFNLIIATKNYKFVSLQQHSYTLATALHSIKFASNNAFLLDSPMLSDRAWTTTSGFFLAFLSLALLVSMGLTAKSVTNTKHT